MIKWLIVVVLLINIIPFSLSATEAKCNAATAVNRVDCTQLNVDENKRCCLFTLGVEERTQCHVVDMSSVMSMSESVATFTNTLDDKENVSFDCGTKIEQCLHVNSPYNKTSCTKILVEYNQTCCMMNIGNDQSCYPLKADSLGEIQTFVTEYKANFSISSTPSVICQSSRLKCAVISLFIIGLTLL